MADETESVLTTQMAGRLVGGMNVMGGDLVVTDRRLIFLPLISKAKLRLTSQAAKVSQHARDWDISPQRLLIAAIMPVAKIIEIHLDQIRSIAATRRCAVLIHWTDSTRPKKIEFAVFASRLSTFWNSANVELRDHLLTTIKAALPADID